MPSEKIAILVDSGSDVPPEFVQKYSMYVAPLTIIYGDGEYRDGVDIDPATVYERFDEGVPSTSLPSPVYVAELFDRIKADGYDKVVVVAISSGLSGTFHMLEGFGPEPVEGLVAYYVDSKNIGIGSGFTAIRAGELIEAGLSFKEVCAGAEYAASNTALYFCVATLEYLRKGGRIGLVAGVMGQLLDVKPVISCNEDGVYHTVGKARGRKKSLQLALQKAIEYADGAKDFNIAVVQGAAEEEGAAMMAALKKALPNYRYAVESPLTPALVVHTGPGLLGIGVQRLA